MKKKLWRTWAWGISAVTAGTAFYVDDNDCRLLGELLDHGIELEIRQVPEEKKKIVTKDMLS